MNRADRRKAQALHPFGWSEWEEATAIPPTYETVESMVERFAPQGYTREDIERMFKDAERDVLFRNNVYQVAVRRYGPGGHFEVMTLTGSPYPVGSMIHLSIKRIDRAKVGTERFAHFQRIKDDLVGADHEAVELYPAAERLTDLANQYHLWVLPSPLMRFPFGFKHKV